MSTDSLAAPARTAIEQCLDLGAEETLVIVTDDARLPIGQALYDVATEPGADVTLLRSPPGDQHGAEPPAAVAAAMQAADAFLAPTSKSISHTRARTDATEAGARGATLPGITDRVFRTGLAADYEAVARTSAALYEQVVDAEEIRVQTPAGTDITVTPGERSWLTDTGEIQQAGAFGNLPAGEIFIAPEDASGRYVVDGTISPHGLLGPDQTVEIEVTDGRVTAIDDPVFREEVEAAAEQGGPGAYNLAELGIGTNTGVGELVGSVLLDEKAAGTVHIAIGDNVGLGGETDAAIHADGVLRDPTVTVDGTPLALPEPAVD